MLWCQVLHINYTTDNICDSLRTEVRGVDTKYLFIQQNSVRSSSTAGHVASLIPLVKSANIILHRNFSFQMLHNSSWMWQRMDKVVLNVYFTSFIIFQFFWRKQQRFVPKIIQLISRMKPFMGNLQREEKSSYLDGLRRDSMLFEDFVEPCKTKKNTGFITGLCI